MQRIEQHVGIRAVADILQLFFCQRAMDIIQQKVLRLLRKFLINLCGMTISCIISNSAWANRWSGERTIDRQIILRIITTDSYKTPP